MTGTSTMLGPCGCHIAVDDDDECDVLLIRVLFHDRACPRSRPGVRDTPTPQPRPRPRAALPHAHDKITAPGSTT